MRNTLIFLLGGVTGGIIGAAGMYVWMKRKDAVDDIPDEYLRSDETADDVNPIDGSSDDYKPLSSTERAQLHAEIARKTERKDYKSIYKPNMKNDISNNEKLLAELQSPPEDPPEEDEELEQDETAADVETAERIYKAHQKEKNRKPRIISADKLGELEGYEDAVLFYYVDDETLATEEGSIIDNEELLIGDALTKYGFADSDERMILVQNFNLRTVYEIQKVNGAYEDSN